MRNVAYSMRDIATAGSLNALGPFFDPEEEAPKWFDHLHPAIVGKLEDRVSSGFAAVTATHGGALTYQGGRSPGVALEWGRSNPVGNPIR